MVRGIEIAHGISRERRRIVGMSNVVSLANLDLLWLHDGGKHHLQWYHITYWWSGFRLSHMQMPAYFVKPSF